MISEKELSLLQRVMIQFLQHTILDAPIRSELRQLLLIHISFRNIVLECLINILTLASYSKGSNESNP